MDDTLDGHKGLFCGGGAGLLGKQPVAILACGAFSSFAVTWVIATAIEATVGFRSPDSYAEVPDADRELAYDFRTVQEVGGLAAAVPGGTDRERLHAIRALVRERDADR